MKGIKYTSGTLTKLGEYYTLTLFNGGEKVYTATLTNLEACKLVEKSNLITFANYPNN